MARDRQRGTIVPLFRFSEANFVSFALNAMNHQNDDEPNVRPLPKLRSILLTKCFEEGILRRLRSKSL